MDKSGQVTRECGNGSKMAADKINIMSIITERRCECKMNRRSFRGGDA